jgi:hypothetical protein
MILQHTLTFYHFALAYIHAPSAFFNVQTKHIHIYPTINTLQASIFSRALMMVVEPTSRWKTFCCLLPLKIPDPHGACEFYL